MITARRAADEAMFTLLLIRHADAVEAASAAAAGIPDSLRPLTEEGKDKMRRIASVVAARVPQLASIVSSPLTRAVETARILASAYPGIRLTESPALEPGAQAASLIEFIHEECLSSPCAFIGHEPDMGRLAAWALCETDRAFMAFKKGGAALLTFPDSILAGRGDLAWFLAPALFENPRVVGWP